MKANPSQNHAMIQIHQLLRIGKDIAERGELPWLADELIKLDSMVAQPHKDANK